MNAKGLASEGIGYLFLKWFFPPIYALTVTPFTVQLFRRFVSSPNLDLQLFNLPFLPLPKVHEFFLPLFILSLELISIQLATAFWGPIDRRRRFLVVVILAGFQLFPYFSVYYDTRITAFDNLKSNLPQVISPQEQSRVDQDYQTQLAAYNSEVTRQQHAYDQQYASYQSQNTADQQRISSLQASIDALNAHINADQSFALSNPGQRTALQQQITDYQTQIAQYQREQAGLQRQLAERTPPVRPAAPALPVKGVPHSQPAQLPYKSDADFLLSTLLQPESLFSVFVSLIFPIIVLGAGFVLARPAHGEDGFEGGEHEVVQLNLNRELQICSRLPEASQNTYVESLKPVILRTHASGGMFVTEKRFDCLVV